ncbi:MAG: serine hydrolase [candidate division KSB1 bacterium]|nr:serine hydrolase [candidate division KSB1 bacterium]
MRKAVVMLLLAGCFASSLWAQEKLPDSLLQKKTLQKIKAFSENWDGVLGMAAMDLKDGEVVFQINADYVFPQASSIKIPIMIEVFRQIEKGMLSLDSTITITSEDVVGGSGRLKNEFKKGAPQLQRTIQELLKAMIIWSDNIATNVLIRVLGQNDHEAGMRNVNTMLDEFGFKTTRLRRKMMDAKAVREDRENISTPLEMVRLIQKIYKHEMASASSCSAMVAILSRVKAGMRAAVSDTSIQVAAKPGGVPGVSCETGIIYLDQRPFALSVMSTFNNPELRERPAKRITEIVYDYFERLAHSNQYGHRFQRRID